MTAIYIDNNEISGKMTTEQDKETASQKYRRKLKENPEPHAEYLRWERARNSKRREVMKDIMETCRFENRKTGKITQLSYVGVCQSDMDEDGETRVQFMTMIDGKRFTEIVNDIADVQFEDIIAKLEAPEKKSDGNNTFIEFSANIDVFEKKY